MKKNESAEKRSAAKKYSVRILKWIGIVLAMLFVLLLLLQIFFARAVHYTAAQIGPMVLKAPLKVGHSSIRPFIGRIELNDIQVGNPAGYTNPNVITVKKIVADVHILSIFSPKIIVEEFTLDGVDVYYEQKLSTNNLSDLQKNAEAFQKALGFAPSGKDGKEAEAPAKKEEPRKLQVDKLQLTHIYVYAGTGKDAQICLPVLPVVLDNLGQGPEGITGSDLTKIILDKITKGSVSAISDAMGESVRKSGQALKEAGEKTSKALRKVGSGISDLFKKK